MSVRESLLFSESCGLAVCSFYFIVDGQAVEMPLWYQIRMKGYEDRLWQAKDLMPIQSY